MQFNEHEKKTSSGEDRDQDTVLTMSLVKCSMVHCCLSWYYLMQQIGSKNRQHETYFLVQYFEMLGLYSCHYGKTFSLENAEISFSHNIFSQI